jgi:hypothetical protein
MTRGPRGIAMALVLALLVGGPLAPLAAAPQTQPAASAEPNQGASSMPSATMEQGPQVQQEQDQQAVGQSQPQTQDPPGVVTQPPAGTPPAETATPPAPPAPLPPAVQAPVPVSQPDQFKETVKSSSRPSRRGADGYDAAAVFVNITRPVPKAILCGLGGVVSAAIFALTFGSAYRGATAAVAEGCGGKWFINGDDLRPDSTPAGSFEWETHQFDWERK